MAKGALKPAFYEDIRTVWKGKEKTSIIEDEDAHLSSLSQLAGWHVLKKHIESLKVGLDKRLSESVLNSLGDAQIKTDALFAVLGKELLDSIVAKVEDSAEVVEKLTDEQQRIEKRRREQGRSG
jgi:hypothetical protein